MYVIVINFKPGQHRNFIYIVKLIQAIIQQRPVTVVYLCVLCQVLLRMCPLNSLNILTVIMLMFFSYIPSIMSQQVSGADVSVSRAERENLVQNLVEGIFSVDKSKESRPANLVNPKPGKRLNYH